ncbi:MAG: hypothetical protein ACTSVW_00055 [Candidatus Njordarchaeales archaeon]
MSKKKSILLLLFFSPMIGELLSGSAPPIEFFNPIGLIMLISLYGCGALIIREIVKRYNKGYFSVLLLGAAYGIWEEGIVVKSFFNPNWPDVGIYGTYGRFLGVNWIWSLELTIYHAVISILVPIITVDLFYKDLRETQFLGKKGLSLAFFAFVLDSFLFNILTPYQPSFLHYIFTIIVIFLIGYFAVSLEFNCSGNLRISAFRMKLLGFSWVTSFFLVFWLSPYIVPNVYFTIFLIVIQNSFFAYYLTKIDWKSLDLEHLYSIIFGILLFFIILAPIQELDNPNRPDDTTGMSLVGIAIFIFLIILRKRIKKKKELQEAI